jgi:hypothetical protein
MNDNERKGAILAELARVEESARVSAANQFANPQIAISRQQPDTVCVPTRRIVSLGPLDLLVSARHVEVVMFYLLSADDFAGAPPQSARRLLRSHRASQPVWPVG